MECLEHRRLLHGDNLAYDVVSPFWFEAPAPISQDVTVAVNANRSSAFIGPRRDPDWQATIGQEWILRLNADAIGLVDAIRDFDSLLDSEHVDFEVVRGLGLPGMVLMQSFAAEPSAAEQWLSSHPMVGAFAANSVVSGAQLPSDPSFPEMTNLQSLGQSGAAVDADIDAPEAWDVTTGSTSVVVGLIDSGVDLTHADLYLNIWLNQGEIPAGLKSLLTDLDGDQQITLWDLNNLRVIGSQIYVASTVELDPSGQLLSGDLATAAETTTATPFSLGSNADLVQDLNANGRIDARDLLLDGRWSEGVDNDGNGFSDDLFGWNFRSDADEPFASNDPSDRFGHGTHLAGTIGAVGNNGVGIAGINWQTSIMPIKFLDARNQGNQADAIAAINYATMMRTQYGVNVRVTNNSWGQAGSDHPLLRSAIAASGEAGILFVAAAGNGDAIGRGVDNDREPFFPASFDLSNVISVAASDTQDTLAAFSNYGSQSVDIAAPGVSVISTLPGDRYGSGNGTSIAAAHVAATAALVWSARPTATAEEVRNSILNTADFNVGLQDRVASQGRLNAFDSVQSENFIPAAVVVSAEDITTAGGSTHQIVVQYHYHAGIDSTSIGDDDLIITRRWGPGEQIAATLVENSIVPLPNNTTYQVTYQIDALGGQWDPLDFGSYDIAVRPETVSSSSGLQFVTGQRIGSFSVRIESPEVFYVTHSLDTVDANVGDGICLDVSGACSLRAAIQEANAAAPSPRTIILDVNEAQVSIGHQVDPSSNFPNSGQIDGLPNVANVSGWSDESTGDLDIVGNVSIVGNQTSRSVIRGLGGDRIFKVHPNGSLSLQRVTISGGVAPADQGGGGILSAGTVELDRVAISGNTSLSAGNGLGGGGIALWGGSLLVRDSTFAGNTAEIGGGLLASNLATAAISGSTFVENTATIGSGLPTVDPERIGGGGIVALKSGAIEVSNTTFSANQAVNAAGAAVGVYSLVPTVNVASTNVPLAIPDTGTVFSELLVSGFEDVLSDLKVQLSIDHTFNGDLNVFLISPSGTRIELFTNVGAGSNNFTNTTLDDDALVTIGSGTAPFTGSFQPEGRLSDLIGEDPNGVWRLEVTDTTLNDIGTLQNWSLLLEPEEGSSAIGYLDHVTAAFHQGASTFAGRVRLHSSLLAGDASSQPIDDAVNDRGFNLITSGDSIGPLQYLGGPTLAHPLNSGNPAIDGADPNDFPANDQIGTERPQRGGDFLTRPDVGAVEMSSGFAEGILYLDRNGNAARDEGELGLPGFTLYVDENQNGILDPDEPQVVTANQETAGEFLFANLKAGHHRISLQLPEHWTVTHQPTALSLRRDDEAGNQHSPALSFDGSSIAFYSDSPDGTAPIVSQLLVFNRNTNTVYTPDFIDDFGFPPEPIPYSAFDMPSLSADGRYAVFLHEFDHPFIPGPHDSVEVVDTRVTEGIPAGFSVASELTGYSPSDGMISLDGRYVAFTSGSDVYRYDRQLEWIEKISQSFDGGNANGNSFNASISQQGRYFAFESTASNLVLPDTNGRIDIFVVDTLAATIERVSDGNLGGQSNADAMDSSISGDGRFVVFASSASNLVAEDTNSTSDIFVFDRHLDVTERVSVSSAGSGGNGSSRRPMLSFDGRFVVFESAATNLIAGDDNGAIDLFVHDRETGTTVRIAESGHNGSISGDGKFIAYVQGSEAFVVNNPLSSISDRTVILSAGETVATSFGIAPAAGEIRGTVFQDLLVNQKRDIADPGLAGWLVYLDLSRNGQLDVGEPQAITASDGSYSFAGIAGYHEYEVRAEAPSGWRPVLPDPQVAESQTVFVDAGQTVVGIDFGFVEQADGDPPQDSAISGLIFQDDNENGIQDAGELGIASLNVFLDLNDDGIWQGEEPITITDASGSYAFTGLGSGVYAVRIANDQYQVTYPIGNDFLAGSVQGRAEQGTLAGFEALIVADLVGDDSPDLINVVYESNLISIRTGDGQGSFDNDAIHVALPAGATGPRAIRSGDLNQQGTVDLVVVNHLSGTVTLLLDFDGTGFASTQTYGVGLQPSDLVIADFDGVNGNDIAVSNAGSDTITLLLHDGSGGYNASTYSSGGQTPTSLVAGHFNQDNLLDLAVANFGNHPEGADLGNLAVLLNQGGSGFGIPATYSVGFGPSAVATGDWNGDGVADLAVTGLLSQSLDWLLGTQAGGFATPIETLTVTGSPLRMASSDIDRDGDRDLLLTDGKTGRLSIVRNELDRGSFAFSPAEVVIESDESPDERSAMVVADLNQDGLDDVVVAGSSGESLRVLQNSLAGGVYRVSVNGTESITDLTVALAPAPDSIVLTGAGETVEMKTLPPTVQASVRTIDIRGTGDNTLILDATVIATKTPDRTLLAIANAGDQVIFDPGWVFSHVQTIEGQFERVFVNGNATVRLIGPRSWTHPINPSDVNGNGNGTAADALAIINALSPRLVIDAQNNLVDPTTISPERFKFYDANRDGRMTAADALFVINRIGRPQANGESESPDRFPHALMVAAEQKVGHETSDDSVDRTANLVDSVLAVTREWL